MYRFTRPIIRWHWTLRLNHVSVCMVIVCKNRERLSICIASGCSPRTFLQTVLSHNDIATIVGKHWYWWSNTLRHSHRSIWNRCLAKSLRSHGFESNSESPKVSRRGQGRLRSNLCRNPRIRFTKGPTEQTDSGCTITQGWLGSYRGRNVSYWRSFQSLLSHCFLTTVCSCTNTSSLEIVDLKSSIFKLFYRSMGSSLLLWVKCVVELWTFVLISPQLPFLINQGQVDNITV